MYNYYSMEYSIVYILYKNFLMFKTYTFLNICKSFVSFGIVQEPQMLFVHKRDNLCIIRLFNIYFTITDILMNTISNFTLIYVI